MSKKHLPLIFIVMMSSYLSGCNQTNYTVSNIPMISAEEGKGPWQVVTYSGKKVTHDTIALDQKKISVKSRSVYLNHKSQFVYVDGTPIETYNGNYIYWNKDGYVINKNMSIVREDTIFLVDGISMHNNTAMKLKHFGI